MEPHTHTKRYAGDFLWSWQAEWLAGACAIHTYIAFHDISYMRQFSLEEQRRRKREGDRDQQRERMRNATEEQRQAPGQAERKRKRERRRNSTAER